MIGDFAGKGLKYSEAMTMVSCNHVNFMSPKENRRASHFQVSGTLTLLYPKLPFLV
jgi:hypothetical protein